MNQELVTIFTEMAELLAMKEVPFKPRAFEKAALAIGELSESVNEIYKKGGLAALEEIPGVGRGIAERIEEHIKTGRIKDYEILKKKMPVRMEELTRIEGIGPKMIKTLYEKLGIRTARQLEQAAKAGKIAKLSRFGKKSEEKILKSIEFLKQSGGRMPIGEALPLARAIKAYLEKVEGVERVGIAGSLRRWQETIGDIDLLAIIASPERSRGVMDAFTRMPGVKHVYAKGDTKSSIRFKQNIDVDLRVVSRASFGAALQYFTGNKAHNVALRKIAIEKGYKLNEYGLFHVGQSRALARRAGKTEEEIYEALGLQYIEPEMRLDEGEIKLAKQRKLPKLIDYGDIRGDLQTQTDWTDGADSIEEMARAAAKLGHEYIAITDHTKGLAMTGGSDEAKLLRQIKEIEKINHKLKIENLPDGKAGCKLKILAGAEVNIKKDGSLDIDDETLAKLDVVGAAIHSHFRLSKKEQTERLIRAMENPHVDIIFHPTARIVQRREPIELDIEAILKAASATGTAMEIDAHPWRLDLKDEHIRLALKIGVKLVIDTDAHSASELCYLEYGIAQARRAGATKKDIINTLPLKEFLKALK